MPTKNLGRVRFNPRGLYDETVSDYRRLDVVTYQANTWTAKVDDVPTGAIPGATEGDAYWELLVDGQFVIDEIKQPSSLTADVISDLGEVSGLSIPTYDEMILSDKLRVNDIVSTLGRSAPGDGGGGTYLIVNPGTGASEPWRYTSISNSNVVALRLFYGRASLRSFGAKGDLVSDDSLAIDYALSAGSALGIEIDGEGLYYRYAGDFFYVSAETLSLRDMTLVYYGPGASYFGKIVVSQKLALNDVSFDANSLTPKGCVIEPSDSDCAIYLNNCSGFNGLQTDVFTGFAAGIEVSPSSETFAQIVVNGGTYKDCTSTRSGTPGSLTAVGRGLFVSNCEITEVYGARFERIGPHYDGDGLVVTGDAAIRERLKFFSDNCSFVDCEKRAIKSQVGGTSIGVAYIERTSAFPDRGAQVEVALLEGGRVGHIIARYASGATPSGVVYFTTTNSSGYLTGEASLGGMTVIAENENDVIDYPVSFSLNESGVTLSASEVSNFLIGCKVKNIAKFYTSNQNNPGVHFSGFALRDILVSGFSGSPENAIVFVTRGSVSYNSQVLEIANVRTKDGTQTPIYYWDTAPGSTSYYTTKIKNILQSSVVNGRSADMISGGYNTFSFFAPEDASVNIRVDIDSAYASIPVSVRYSSSRTDANTKLHTSGIVATGSDATYYDEIEPGKKSFSSVGGINISADSGGKGFNVTKTSGSLSASGFLYITLLDIGDGIKVEKV